MFEMCINWVNSKRVKPIDSIIISTALFIQSDACNDTWNDSQTNPSTNAIVNADTDA